MEQILLTVFAVAMFLPLFAICMMMASDVGSEAFGVLMMLVVAVVCGVLVTLIWVGGVG